MATSLTITTILDDITPVQRTALGVFISGSIVPSETSGALAPMPAVSMPALAVSTADVFFPPHPSNAKFPSPEGSTMRRFGGTLEGSPYLIDASGTVYQLCDVTDACPQGFSLNGAPHAGGYPGNAYVLIQVRQGRVYMQAAGGQWQGFQASQGSTYNTDLPDAWPGGVAPTAAQVATTSAAAAAVRPTPSAVTGGSTGRVVKAAPGGVAAAVSTLVDGDTLALDGHYTEAFPRMTTTVLVQLSATTVLDFTGIAPEQLAAHGKGGIVCAKDFIIDGGGGGTIMGVGRGEDAATLICAVRPDDGCGYVTLRNGLVLTGNQNGLGGGGTACVYTVDGCHLTDNGLPVGKSGNGYTHNVYVGEGGASGPTVLVMTNTVSDKPLGGHAVKSRAVSTTLIGCTMDATDATVVDLCEGSGDQAVIRGCHLTKPGGSANHGVLGYATENTKAGLAGLLVTDTVIAAMCDSPLIQGNEAATVTIGAGVTFLGNKVVAEKIKVTGL